MITALLTGIAGSPGVRAAPRHGVIAVAVLLFLLALRRPGEHAGRVAERLEIMEKDYDAQGRMLEAAALRPLSRDALGARCQLGTKAHRSMSAGCGIQPRSPCACG